MPSRKKSLSRNTLLTVIGFSVLEAFAIMLILLKFYPFIAADGSNCFGSVLTVPADARVDSVFFVIELVACVLPLSVVAVVIMLADLKRGGGG